ncbi:MAG: hypothetical protein M3R39_10965 [Actinomycetota bacterium]|nr:hypothetical protein [Actinomycetota bacterium]
MPRIALAALAALVTLAAGLVVAVVTLRGAPSRVPAEPARPSSYPVPSGAATVSTSAGLLDALSRPEPRDIVLADGSYDNADPFVDRNGHRVFAQHLGRARLRAGFVLDGSTGGAVLQGLSFDLSEPGKAFNGSIVNVHGAGADNQLLDLTLDGHGALSAGLFVRQAEGLTIRRIVARNFRDWGVLVDPNDRSLHPAHPPAIEDVTSSNVSLPVARSSNGTSEACVWVGVTSTVRRIKTRNCGWEGLWVGSGTRDSVFEDLDINDTGIGIYVEHFASGSTFRRAHVGPNVERGATCEWDDPVWGGRPACTDNVFEDSTFDTRLIGVYLDEGTADTTVRRSVFLHQRCGAIGDYAGVGNLWDTSGNDYRGIAASAVPVWRDHLYGCKS